MLRNYFPKNDISKQNNGRHFKKARVLLNWNMNTQKSQCQLFYAKLTCQLDSHISKGKLSTKNEWEIVL